MKFKCDVVDKALVYPLLVLYIGAITYLLLS